MRRLQAASSSRSAAAGRQAATAPAAAAAIGGWVCAEMVGRWGWVELGRARLGRGGEAKGMDGQEGRRVGCGGERRRREANTCVQLPLLYFSSASSLPPVLSCSHLAAAAPSLMLLLLLSLRDGSPGLCPAAHFTVRALHQSWTWGFCFGRSVHQR
ncbi:hypothetical protein Mapa_009267 [Marchantia paleacea]|nr:hypothetical protein Mapa_009267 [Marchantia paleacea]